MPDERRDFAQDLPVLQGPTLHLTQDLALNLTHDVTLEVTHDFADRLDAPFVEWPHALRVCRWRDQRDHGPCEDRRACPSPVP